MMMESVFDPFDSLFANEPMPLSSDGHLLNDQIILDDFNFDPSPFSPTSETMANPELNFDIDMFQKFLDQLISSDSSLPIETSFDILPPSIESEPATREMGTDPMVEASPPFQPPVIQTTKLLRTVQTTQGNHSFNQPIIIIQPTNKASLSNTSASTFFVTPSLPTKNYSLPLETSVPTIDYPLESFEPMSPSTSNDSFDEPVSSSPDTSQEHHQANMVTNLAASPKSGPLVLTNEELKLIKLEGHQAPTKLPLSKSEEKLLKRVQRKIKNKISAQESRRKKKEYVDALEKQIARYVDENTALKERMTTIEKSQKTLAQERDLLRSMIGKGATAAPSTALMVFVLFFAVLFGIWSPITTKPAIDDRSLSPAIALVPSSSYLTALPSQSSLLEQQKATHSNPVTDTYKSRVLLSVDEQHDQHHYGPYLPNNHKYKSSAQSHLAAPGYTYSKTVEKYMNKKIKSIQSGEDIKHFKRSISDESSAMILDEKSGYKKRRTNYHPHEKVVIIEETQDPTDNGLNESKSVKIIRVERTIPVIGNDTLKLVHRTTNE